MNTTDIPVIIEALKDGYDTLMLVPPTEQEHPTQCIHWGETGLEHVSTDGIKTITETELQQLAGDWVPTTV